MRKFVYLASLVLATVAFVACNPNPPENKTQKGINPFDEDAATGFYGYAEISVPAGVTTVYMENYAGLDEQGNKKDLTVTPIQVKPIVEQPKDGKDVEPFGKVKLLFEAPKKTMVAIYYVAGNGAANYTVADHGNYAPSAVREDEEEQRIEEVFTLNDFPLDQITSGEFGKTRYVRVQWGFAWENSAETNWKNTEKYPKDVLYYDPVHNHTLRYKFAYSGVQGEAYLLDDAYEIENHVATAYKYSYCNSCGSCEYCMPWGCSCGCGSVNPNFQANGNLLSGNTNNIEIDGSEQSSESATEQVQSSLIPDDVTTVYLPEPAPYVTSDEDQTFYHSSGVVMFEDSWPTVNQGGVYDTDFNDCVIDYDIEAKTVADAILEEQGYREQVKVVLHLRAVGSNIPYRVGVRLEDFDTENVEYIEQFFTLDSWQNPHGELPKFTESTIQHMSNHYETAEGPVVEMAHIFTMTQERAGKGADAIYTYENNGNRHETVFNLCYGQYPDKYPDASQYKPELESITSPTSFSQIRTKKWYNAIPGYMNVAGGLVTMTVIYHMKPRAEMEPAEREAVKQNMINAVVNTTSQNFYIIRQDFVPVGLKGYQPVLFHQESLNKYQAKLNEGVANGSIDAANPYAGTNGAVWGFKCPTLTRHIWNKLYFSQAYPHYEEWVSSMGAQHPNWYNEDVNDLYMVCWW